MVRHRESELAKDLEERLDAYQSTRARAARNSH